MLVLTSVTTSRGFLYHGWEWLKVVRHDNENSNRENDDNWKNMKKQGGGIKAYEMEIPWFSFVFFLCETRKEKGLSKIINQHSATLWIWRRVLSIISIKANHIKLDSTKTWWCRPFIFFYFFSLLTHKIR